MSALSLMGAGGPILIVLALLSVLSLAVIVHKAIQLRGVTAGQPARDAALEEWAAGRRDGARSSVSQGRAPADRVLGFAMDRLDQGHRGPALASVLVHRGSTELAQMMSLIRLLELIAMIGPLLGLLGTVLGMIQSFQELSLAEGSANASILADGIWQALLTTAAGLLVAIPAAVGASLLAARAEAGARMIEESVSELLLIDDARKAA
ncbi:MotA/TolQ/ExbB proton channel family protein [Aquicoccus sp. SCR17]|nr:MotA/TolQ/ExbB proton channel family protein [Carideicomes alvinocaridis]